MSNQEILEKAIQKAIAGGFVTNLKVYPYDIYENFITIHYLDEDADVHIYQIIFDHDFAKALWGEHTDTLTVQNNTLNVKQVIDMNGWQYHLQQMVITDDPIKYLGKQL